MKPDQNIINKPLFRVHTSISPEEVLAAGGATAFGIKSGKTVEALKEALRNAPQPEPFTDEEWASIMIPMENDR